MRSIKFDELPTGGDPRRRPVLAVRPAPLAPVPTPTLSPSSVPQPRPEPPTPK